MTDAERRFLTYVQNAKGAGTLEGAAYYLAPTRLSSLSATRWRLHDAGLLAFEKYEGPMQLTEAGSAALGTEE